jgi:hypothetical protein
MRFPVFALALGLLVCAAARSQTTDPEPVPPGEPAATAPLSAGIWRLMASPYSLHYSHDPEHRPVYMVGLERQLPSGTIWGGTYFSNSFGQPSAYVYGGKRLSHWSAYDQLFAQWTVGLLYGYKGEYKDKVPFNHGGFSPGAVLAVGWQFTPMVALQFNVLGNSALMFQFSLDLP